MQHIIPVWQRTGVSPVNTVTRFKNRPGFVFISYIQYIILISGEAALHNYLLIILKISGAMEGACDDNGGVKKIAYNVSVN
jgi:hypothetical protein